MLCYIFSVLEQMALFLFSFFFSYKHKTLAKMKREKKFHLSTGTHSDVHALGELGHEADLRNQQKSCEHDFTE